MRIIGEIVEHLEAKAAAGRLRKDGVTAADLDSEVGALEAAARSGTKATRKQFRHLRAVQRELVSLEKQETKKQALLKARDAPLPTDPAEIDAEMAELMKAAAAPKGSAEYRSYWDEGGAVRYRRLVETKQ